MIDAGEWGDAKPDHFVALYHVMWERVYRVPCDQLLNETAWTRARDLVKDLQGQLGGDVLELAAFECWIWNRETGRERWRRQNPGKHGGATLTFRDVFTDRWVPAWRVDEARSG